MNQNENFILRIIYDKAILVPFKRNNISDFPIYLNPVGAKIYTLTSSVDNKQDLLRKIQMIYNLENVCDELKDVESFIDNMIDIGLIGE